MNLNSHPVLVVAGVMLGIGSLVSWYWLHKWTERGTEGGLSESPVSTFSRGTVTTAWFFSIVVNGFLSGSESSALTVIRRGIAVAIVTSLLAWALGEWRRHSSAAVVDDR